MEPEKKLTPPSGEPAPVLSQESIATDPLPPVAPIEPPEPEEESRASHWRSALSTIGLFALAPLVALGIAAFVMQSYQVDGESMETTLQNSDRLIVDKVPRSWSRITHHAYLPPRGQIIIFNQNLDLGTGFGEKQLVKRVIGLPGERVVVNNGGITIYNQQHSEGYDPDKTGQYHITAPTTPGQVDLTLTKNQIFVCGDNRTNSEDSRYFGPVELNKVVGKLSFRILPLSKIQHY